jgi:hypothetical protein
LPERPIGDHSSLLPIKKWCPEETKQQIKTVASEGSEPEIKSIFGEYPRFFELSHQFLFQVRLAR